MKVNWRWWWVEWRREKLLKRGRREEDEVSVVEWPKGTKLRSWSRKYWMKRMKKV